MNSYAYNLGYEAAKKNVNLHANPYYADQPQWYEWRAGWFDYVEGAY